MLNIVTKLYNFITDDEGQGLAEYALILVLVSIVAVGALTALGGQITTVFSTITTNLQGS
ncbi:MAG: Flp family type IVb pilin [Acidobacteriota bacterium]|nr:Flp family type IVb pilin [Blastocatellia bacterium]MDW8240867.1 Flp family type IVb pilin [Acidobacteriota bacterium]